MISLKARVEDNEGVLKDNDSDISALDMRVSDNEGDITVLDMMTSINMMSIDANYKLA